MVRWNEFLLNLQIACVNSHERSLITESKAAINFWLMLSASWNEDIARLCIPLLPVMLIVRATN